MLFKKTRATRAFMLAVSDPFTGPSFPAADAEQLIAQGAQVTGILPPDGASLLSEVAVMGNIPVAEVLLRHGADPNGNALRRHLPLNAAVQNAYGSLVELLVANGADINLQDALGTSPLHTAVTGDTARRSGMPELVMRLGADPSLRNSRGLTALEDFEYMASRMIGGPYASPEDDEKLIHDRQRLRRLLVQ